MEMRSKTLSLGAIISALGGVAAIAMMSAKFDINDANLFATIGLYLLIAVLFFAIAGSFSAKGQWPFEVVILMGFINAALIIADIIIGFIPLEYGLILVVIAAIVIADVALANDSRAWFGTLE